MRSLGFEEVDRFHGVHFVRGTPSLHRLRVQLADLSTFDCVEKKKRELCI